MAVKRLSESGRCFRPDLIGPDIFFGVLRGEIESELLKTERPQHRQYEVKQARNLVGQLLLSAVDMAVVLGEPTNPHQPVQRSGTLVAVDGAELK